MVRKTHPTPRFPIKLKKYTHEIAQLQSKSGQKLKLKVILSASIDLLVEFKLVRSNGKFLLADREAVMVGERELADGSGWNTVYVDSEDTVEKLKAEADKSGIARYHIVDHLIRLVRDLKMLSTDRKGKNRLRAAIEAIGSKAQVDKIHPIESKPLPRGQLEDLMREYPMFKRRLIDDIEFAEMIQWASTNPDLVRRLAGIADELRPTMTHLFTCEKTGLQITDRFNVECPDEEIRVLENCISGCKRLGIERRSDYVMPEGYYLDYGLAERIGLGQPVDDVLYEAYKRGCDEYADEQERIIRGDPQNGLRREQYPDRLD